MYCPLSQPSVLHFVLSTAIMQPINFTTLRLCYNGIRRLKIEVLVKASYLRNLDVSHNEVCCRMFLNLCSFLWRIWPKLMSKMNDPCLFQLLYPNDIKDLQMLNQVTRLVMDGNPLCADYRTPEEYIRSVPSQWTKFVDIVLTCVYLSL